MSAPIRFIVQVGNHDPRVAHAAFNEPSLDDCHTQFKHDLRDVAREAKSLKNKVGTTKSVSVLHEETGHRYRVIYDAESGRFKWLCETDDQMYSRLETAINKTYVKHDAGDGAVANPRS